jgi:hypothetical protein
VLHTVDEFLKGSLSDPFVDLGQDLLMFGSWLIEEASCGGGCIALQLHLDRSKRRFFRGKFCPILRPCSFCGQVVALFVKFGLSDNLGNASVQWHDNE